MSRRRGALHVQISYAANRRCPSIHDQCEDGHSRTQMAHMHQSSANCMWPIYDGACLCGSRFESGIKRDGDSRAERSQSYRGSHGRLALWSLCRCRVRRKFQFSRQSSLAASRHSGSSQRALSQHGTGLCAQGCERDVTLGHGTGFPGRARL